MHNDEPSLLDAIHERPDDDLPRLVYADWLEERGDPRAEFIRVQCQLAEGGADDERRPALLHREAQLLAEHGAKWSAPLSALATRWLFRRGFVHHATLPARVFLDRGTELFAAAPLRRVRLTDLDQRVVVGTELGDSRWLPRLEGLELAGRMSAEQLRALLRSPGAASLRCLGLRGELSPAGLTPLGEGALPMLDELDLRDLPISRHLEWLADARFRLRHLGLSRCGLVADDARTLADSGQLGHLTRLRLRENRQLGGIGVEQLVGSPQLEHLRYLDLHACHVVGRGLRALVRSPALRALVSLDVSDNHLPNLIYRHLAKSAQLVSLRELNLSNNLLSESGVQSLLSGPLVGRLRSLHLHNCGVNNSGLEALAGSPLVESLRTLGLAFNAFGARGVTALAESAHVAGLRQLTLGFNRIDSQAVAALANSARLGELVSLDLADCMIDQEGALALARSTRLKSLIDLRIVNNPVFSQAARTALERRFGASVLQPR